MPEVERQAALVLVDAAVAQDSDAGYEANANAVNLALARLHEIGAVTASIDDD